MNEWINHFCFSCWEDNKNWQTVHIEIYTLKFILKLRLWCESRRHIAYFLLFTMLNLRMCNVLLASNPLIDVKMKFWQLCILHVSNLSDHEIRCCQFFWVAPGVILNCYKKVMCVEILEIPLVLQETINQPSIKRLLLLQYSHSETCYAALVYNKLFKAARTQATCLSVRYLQNTVIIRVRVRVMINEWIMKDS